MHCIPLVYEVFSSIPIYSVIILWGKKCLELLLYRHIGPCVITCKKQTGISRWFFLRMQKILWERDYRNLPKISPPSKKHPPPFFEWSCCKGCFSLESTPTHLCCSTCCYVKQEAPKKQHEGRHAPLLLLHRPFSGGMASWLAAAIYVAMVTPILYNNSYCPNDSNLKYESYRPYSWF